MLLRNRFRGRESPWTTSYIELDKMFPKDLVL
jgi:hypothetical protein